MYLKSLEIQGYKSFASKFHFLFSDGITAIVGPNGSGKSNVADAIRWVLGEQSYINLRGKRTEDMIFSGSDARARLGMAQVTLTLDNSNGWLPVDFSEVVLCRRAYRSGENDYYLNGSRVRLKDVNELLAKSGLSRRTYMVIGQGMVDRALSLRPEERRELFEEAAGITLHQQRRREALEKLESTRANLVRLKDITVEIEPRLHSLQRQADRVVEYQRFWKNLSDLLREWYGYRWRNGQQVSHEAHLRLNKFEESIIAQENRLQEIAQAIAGLRSTQTNMRRQLGEWHASSSQLHDQAEKIQRSLAVSEERARSLNAQEDELSGELIPLTSSLDEQAKKVAEAEADVQVKRNELAEARNSLLELKDQLQRRQKEQAGLLARKTQFDNHLRRLENAIAEKNTRAAQKEEQLAETDRQRQEEEISQRQLQSQLSTTQAGYKKLEEELKALDETDNNTALKIQETQQAVQEIDNQIAALRSKLAERQRRYDSLLARQEYLRKMKDDLSGYYEGVKAVMKAAREDSHLNGILGTVSQLIQVPPKLETAIETTLGGRLQDIITDSWDSAEEAIKLLKKTGEGRATFLPLDTIRSGEPISPLPKGAGILGLAVDLIQFEKHLSPAMAMLLNRTLCVDQLPTARRAYDQLKGSFQIVTLDGELLRSSGAVSGGRSTKGGGSQLLAREREFRELPDQLAQARQAQEEVEKEIVRVDRQKQSQLEKIQALSAEREKINQERERQRARLNESRAQMERLKASLELRQQLLKRLVNDWQQSQGVRQKLKEEIAQLGKEKETVTVSLAEVNRQLEAISLDAMLEELNRHQTSLALLQGKLQNSETILGTHRSHKQELEQQNSRRQARLEEMKQENRRLLAEITSSQIRLTELQSQLDELQALITPQEADLLQREAEQTRLEDKENALRMELHRLQEERSQRNLEYARLQDELENLQKNIEEDLGMVQVELAEDQVGQPWLPIEPLVSQLPVVSALRPGLEEDIRHLRLQIKRMGSINEDAPHEYGELKERYEFLTSQIADLEKASSDLVRIIAELDEQMKKNFIETFNEVAEHFKQNFKELFNGGEARLVLSESDELEDQGVDIVARPPGKRLQSLAMLSGGERCLTAVALIFSLLKASRTPFCILDEVDAMLDEANVNRFRDALINLSQGHTQFIIITHNRKTVEAASTIYGISMGDDSSSRMLSYKLIDEIPAEQIAQNAA